MLRKGQIFKMDGLSYKVQTVTPSRAHCVAKVATLVTIKGRTFKAHKVVETDISPNTCVEVLQELGL